MKKRVASVLIATARIAVALIIQSYLPGGPTRVCFPNGISIGSVVFAQLTQLGLRIFDKTSKRNELMPSCGVRPSVRPSLNICANRFFSQTRTRWFPGSSAPGCAEDQGRGHAHFFKMADVSDGPISKLKLRKLLFLVTKS